MCCWSALSMLPYPLMHSFLYIVILEYEAEYGKFNKQSNWSNVHLFIYPVGMHLCLFRCVSSQPVCGGVSLLLSCSMVVSSLAWFSAISCSSLTSAPVFWTPSGTYNAMPFSFSTKIQDVSAVQKCPQSTVLEKKWPSVNVEMVLQLSEPLYSTHS